MAGVVERLFVAQPVPIGGGSVIASPFQFLLTGEDTLQLVVWCSHAGITVRLQGRVIRYDSTIEPFTFTYAAASDRLARGWNVNLGQGYLLNCSVVGQAAPTLVPGEVFARLNLQRGTGAGTTLLGTILQGYITNTQALAFPGSPITLSTEGNGLIREVLGTQPAAGLEVYETVPTGARWKLLTVFTTLTTDAVVGPRRPYLRILNTGGQYLVQSLSPATIGAASGGGCFYVHGMPLETAIGGLTDSVAGLPTEAVLLAGFHVVVDALNISAGDQFSAPYYIVREWLEANA